MNISHTRRHLLAVVAAATAASLLVAGCSGGGSARSTPAAKAQSAVQRVPFRFKLGAGRGPTTSSKRSPRFVSAGTTIIGLAISGGTGGANASNTGETYYNVSSGSPLCVPDIPNNTRICTVFLNVAADSNITFAFQLFGDSVTNPAATITVTPAPAEVLAQSTVTSSVIAGQPNTVSVTMQGTPASATISPIGFVAENASIAVPLTIAVFDAAGFEIVTDPGNAQDVYDSSVPVQLALSENGNLGGAVTHVSLTRNSSPISSTVTLTTQQDGQGISLVYDGGASGSYAANAVINIGAGPHIAPPEADLLAVALSPDELTLNSGGGPATFSIVAPQFVPATDYTIDSSTCSASVVASVVDNTNDTFTVTPGNGVGACSVNLNFSGAGVVGSFTLSVDVLVLM